MLFTPSKGFVPPLSVKGALIFYTYSDIISTYSTKCRWSTILYYAVQILYLKKYILYLVQIWYYVVKKFVVQVLYYVVQICTTFWWQGNIIHLMVNCLSGRSRANWSSCSWEAGRGQTHAGSRPVWPSSSTRRVPKHLKIMHNIWASIYFWSHLVLLPFPTVGFPSPSL